MKTRSVFGSFAVALAALTFLGSTPGKARAIQGGKLKFEIYSAEGKEKEFRWRLKAANGEILATAGQGYKAKADCKNGVERIMKDAAEKLKFETYEDNEKKFRWRLKASNGQIIATSSQGYKAKVDCEHAVDLIKKGAESATVADMT